MQALTDYQLVQEVQLNNSSEAVSTLIDRHTPLVASMAKKYHKAAPCSGAALEDFIDEAPILVMKAAQNFKPEKNVKFCTWLGNMTRFHFLNTIKAEAKYYNTTVGVAKEVVLGVIDEKEEANKAFSITKEYIQEILGRLRNQQLKQLITMRYFGEKKEDRKFETIAKKLDLTLQMTNRLHRQFLRFMRNKVDSLDNSDII